MAESEMLGPVAPRTWLMGTEAFEGVMPHHSGMRALWETKWKLPVGFCFPRGGEAVLTDVSARGACIPSTTGSSRTLNPSLSTSSRYPPPLPYPAACP